MRRFLAILARHSAHGTGTTHSLDVDGIDDDVSTFSMIYTTFGHIDSMELTSFSDSDGEGESRPCQTRLALDRPIYLGNLPRTKPDGD